MEARILGKHDNGGSAAILMNQALLNFTEGHMLVDADGWCGKHKLRGTITRVGPQAFRWFLYSWNREIETGVAHSCEIAKRRMVVAADTLNP